MEKSIRIRLPIGIIDLFTEDYQIAEERRYSDLHDLLGSLVPSGSKVLDVGCGSGKFMDLLREQKSCRCTGIDISEISIDIIHKKGFEGFTANLPRLPNEIGEGLFDICVMLETLEHISNAEKALRNLRRILKEGGRMIVSVPNDSMRPEEFCEHLHSFNLKNFHHLLNRVFRVEKCFPYESAGHKYIVAEAVKQ